MIVFASIALRNTAVKILSLLHNRKRIITNDLKFVIIQVGGSNADKKTNSMKKRALPYSSIKGEKISAPISLTLALLLISFLYLISGVLPCDVVFPLFWECFPNKFINF